VRTGDVADPLTVKLAFEVDLLMKDEIGGEG
jgi:hypothetical protein